MKKEGRFGQEYNCIDVARFLCSLMVFMIHVPPFESKILNFYVQDCLARIAIPYFFICAGFFLYKKTSYQDFEIKRSLKYVLTLFEQYLLWTIIYFPIKVRELYINNKGVMHSVLLFIRDFFVVGSYTHLWFLPALISAVLCVSFLLYKRVKPVTITLISLVLYLLGLLSQSWYGIIVFLKQCVPVVWRGLVITQKIIVTSRNGVFYGFLFVAIGMLFAYYKDIFHFRLLYNVVGVTISCFLLILEAGFCNKQGYARVQDMYFMLIPTAFFLFAVTLSIRLRKGKLCYFLRRMSKLIFYLHMWIKYIVNYLYESFEKKFHVHILFELTLFVTLFISLLCIFVSNRKALLKNRAII